MPFATSPASPIAKTIPTVLLSTPAAPIQRDESCQLELAAVHKSPLLPSPKSAAIAARQSNVMSIIDDVMQARWNEERYSL